MKALLVIDMLNDFVEEGGTLVVPKAKSLIPAINAEIKKFREADEAIIFVCDSHAKNDEEFKLWHAHCVAGTKGAEIVKGLDYKKGDVIVRKTRYSAFYKTNLEKLLKNKKIDTLVLAGILTDICVLYTAGDAYVRGFKVIVPKNCVASVSEERHEWALKHMGEVLNAEVAKE
jgi:nicotinamidase-related amidase